MLDWLPDFDAIGLIWVWVAFGVATLVILGCGVLMTETADRLADQSGLGEAVVGGVLLGAATSLSGVVVSISAALDDRASLAFSNALGGIAAQTAFLAVADLVYKRANLEHASAELANLFQSSLLMTLMTIPLVAAVTPEVTIWSVHPASPLLLAAYVLGVRATQTVRDDPMWRPTATALTRKDTPEEARRRGRALAPMVIRFALLAGALGLSGWVISECAGRIVDDVGLAASTVGALFTAVSTSLPELVTTLAAVRRGAVQLAVGGIIGGNTFDVLFLVVSDAAYRDGSLYHAVDAGDLFWVTIGLLMTTVLMLGLILRERRGMGGIGFESVGLLGVYGGAVLIQAFMG